MARAQSEPTRVESSLLVPFGVSGVDDVTLAAGLTGLCRDAMNELSESSDVAKAPLVDILTLIECPDGGDACIGNLAEALSVDLAIVGRVVSSNDGSVAEVMFIRRDGTFDKLRHVLAGAGTEAKTNGFRVALRAKLKLGPDPRAVAALSSSAVSQANAAAPSDAAASQADMAPAAAFDPAPARSPERDAEHQGLRGVRPISWATAAGGVISLGIGAAFWAKSTSTEDEVGLLAAPRTNAEFVALRELEDRGDRERTTSAVFLTVGALATAAGVVLVVWDSQQPADSTRLTVAPVRAEGLSASITGSF